MLQQQLTKKAKLRPAHLSKSIWQVFFCSQHVCNPHQCIINSHTEVVDGQAVAAQHHKVSKVVGVPGHLATHDIIDADFLHTRKHVGAYLGDRLCGFCGMFFGNEHNIWDCVCVSFVAQAHCHLILYFPANQCQRA